MKYPIQAMINEGCGIRDCLTGKPHNHFVKSCVHCLERQHKIIMEFGDDNDTI